MEQPHSLVRQQDSSSGGNSRWNEYQAPRISESAQSKPASHTGFSQMSQQSFNRPPNPTHQYSQQARPPPAHVPPPSKPPAQHNSWKFTNSFGPQKPSFEGNMSTNKPQTAQRTQVEKCVNIYIHKQRIVMTVLVLSAAFVFVLCRRKIQ